MAKIRVAVKLSPFFTNLSRFARRLDQSGADALVLFNRFYQPDIELETLEVSPNLLLSTPMAMRCRCAGSRFCMAESAQI